MQGRRKRPDKLNITRGDLVSQDPAQTQKTQPKQRLGKLFITKQGEKQGTKIKLGCLPTSAIV